MPFFTLPRLIEREKGGGRESFRKLDVLRLTALRAAGNLSVHVEA